MPRTLKKNSWMPRYGPWKSGGFVLSWQIRLQSAFSQACLLQAFFCPLENWSWDQVRSEPNPLSIDTPLLSGDRGTVERDYEACVGEWAGGGCSHSGGRLIAANQRSIVDSVVRLCQSKEPQSPIARPTTQPVAGEGGRGRGHPGSQRGGNGIFAVTLKGKSSLCNHNRLSIKSRDKRTEPE
jgi:hypothetical protein